MIANTFERSLLRRFLFFVMAAALTAPSIASASQIAYTRTFPATGHSSIMLAGGIDLTPDSFGNRNPSWSPDGSKIAFQSNRDGGSRIYVMNSNGTDTRNVSGDNTDDSLPSWSPDGNKIAFTRNYDIYTMKPDGSGVIRLTYGDHRYASAPKWSPDGSKLAFFDYSGGGIYHVWTMKSDGSNPQDLTGQSGISAENPSWSPDGSQIAFDGYVPGPSSWDIYTMNANGSGIKDITEDIGVRDVSDTQPAWTAGGITFVTTRSDSRDNKGYLAKMTVTGGNFAPVTDNAGAYTDSAPTPGSTLAPDVKSYVALGDSIASGEGLNYNWAWNPDTGGLDGTWQIGNANPKWVGDADHQVCHQSVLAYPYQLAVRKNYVLRNLACTGAGGQDGIFGPQTRDGVTLPPQLGTGSSANLLYDRAKPDVVTLDIGANDVHFVEIVKGCYGPSWNDCGTGAGDAKVSADLAQERLNLSSILKEIHDRGVTAGKIPKVYLVNYANPFPAVYVPGCHDLNPVIGVALLSPTEMQWLTDQLHGLNANIAAEATKFSNVSLVDIEGLYQPKTSTERGHTFCSGSPWVYGAQIKVGNGFNPSPFHPSPVGQSEIAAASLAILQ